MEGDDLSRKYLPLSINISNRGVYRNLSTERGGVS